MRRKREEQANDKYAHLRKVERDRVWGEEGFTVQDGPVRSARSWQTCRVRRADMRMLLLLLLLLDAGWCALGQEGMKIQDEVIGLGPTAEEGTRTRAHARRSVSSGRAR